MYLCFVIFCYWVKSQQFSNLNGMATMKSTACLIMHSLAHIMCQHWTILENMHYRWHLLYLSVRLSVVLMVFKQWYVSQIAWISLCCWTAVMRMSVESFKWALLSHLKDLCTYLIICQLHITWEQWPIYLEWDTLACSNRNGKGK